MLGVEKCEPQASLMQWKWDQTWYINDWTKFGCLPLHVCGRDPTSKTSLKQIIILFFNEWRTFVAVFLPSKFPWILVYKTETYNQVS